MLIVAAAVAVASVFAGQALGGRVWAMGLTIALVSVPAAMVAQAAFFLLGSVFARWLGAQNIIARTSRGGVETTDAQIVPGGDVRTTSPSLNPTAAHAP